MKMLAMLALLPMLAGCLMSPNVKMHEAGSVRAPIAARPAEAGNGAIFQVASYHPLFEDRRARFVGDTLTISINEKISAAQKSNTSVSRTGSVSLDVPVVQRLPGKSFQGAQLDASSSNKSDGKGEAASSNNFSGTITVTVIEVLPNGNLVVAGDKEIGTNHELERLRFSGIVNPVHIMAGNTISSTQVADARLDYRGEGAVDSAQVVGWLARFFLTFMPF